MTTPPSSLPSPTPSSGSSQHNKPQSFSSIAALQPASTTPAGSSAGTATGATMNQSIGAPGDNAPSQDLARNPSRETSTDSMVDDTQQTPQPHVTGGMGSNSGGFQNSAAFLPQVTASPPPHPPLYVPPAQHAMAPDPIHSLPLSGQPVGSVWGAPGWRPGPPGGPGFGHQQGYRGPPNGHLTHQLPPNPLEAYGPGSRQSMSSTPSGGPMGGPNGTHVGRSGSQGGEPRDRRRDRHRDDESRDREEEEVISTIFVVGFPDDMSEREFQNIFTFAAGFEAATLKFPSGSRREPVNAALIAELQHLAANQQNNMAPPLMSPEHPDQPIDEAFAVMNFGTQSSTASNTPSAAMSLTPSAPSGPTLGATAIPPSVPPRRQTIGFARFKTRGDALAARDHLQGRRIDPLTGATLKAEMAKKNLHTKRGVGVGGEDLVGMLLRSGRLSQLVSQQAQAQALSAAVVSGLGQPSAGGNMPGGNVAPGQNTATAQSAKEAWDNWPALSPSGMEAKTDKLAAPQQGTTSSTSNTSGSPPLSVKSPNSRPTDSKALLALAEEADELEGWSVGSVGMGIGFDYPGGTAPGSGPNSRAGGGPLAVGGSLGPAAGNGPHGGVGGFGYGQPGGFGSELGGFGVSGQHGVDLRSMGMGANMNPADQNPPINTLYIGNLPAISPPTHPPNFLEESLRALFQRRPGFKRMSFRQKINGPMCFVEFEDIPYATQAMRELYGNTLNGLVKGGIRLSYSKNSLGQRGNSHQQGVNTSMFGGIAHTVALAGMAPAPSGNPVAAFGGPSAPVPIGPPSSNSTAGPGPAGRGNDAPSSLSPTAQPFSVPLPATSPRSQRYYGGNEGGRPAPAGPAGAVPSGNGNQVQASVAIPNSNKTDAASAFNSFTPSSAQSGFSPVSSPIRTPASLGWVSSTTPTGGSSATFGAFDAFGLPPHGLSSLNGAASAWGQANSNTQSS